MQDSQPAAGAAAKPTLFLADRVNDAIGNVLPFWETNLALRATILVVTAVVVAKVTDWVLTRLLRRWVRGTASTIDDRLLEILHRPIFTSVLVFGSVDRCAQPGSSTTG